MLSEIYFQEKENLDKYVAMIDRRAREAYKWVDKAVCFMHVDVLTKNKFEKIKKAFI